MADIVKLNNGQTTDTEILDTSGCSITIKRKNSKAIINKKLIDYIIVNTDTIRYAGYKCIKKTKLKVQKYNKTVEIKTLSYLAKADTIDPPLRESSIIGYCKQPLLGRFPENVLNAIAEDIKPLLSKKHTVNIVSLDSALMIFKRIGTPYDYLFLPQELKIIELKDEKDFVQYDRTVKYSSFSLPGKTVSTSMYAYGKFALYDVKKQAIVFSTFVKTKKTAKNEWGILSNLFISEETKDEIHNSKVKKAEEKLTGYFSRKLSRELKRNLKLED